MDKWEKRKFSDIVIFNPKEILKKGTIAKKIPMDMLVPFCRDIPNFEIAKFNGGTKFRNGDTIMARITPCLENGKTAKVNILNDNEIGFGSTEYIVFRAIDGITTQDFVYYLVCSSTIRTPAIKSMVGSSGRQRVQTDVLQNLEITIPDYETQQKISSILSAIDDKIELNSKINANLEQQAQAIFKSWFVDFEPFGGVMPDDWKEANLLNIANYLNGLAMQKFRPKEYEIGLP
ncbi:MAG: restriction endonuclease subunit S, partial [Lachnospiraceae bacterium]|nr:restriction endonuclease subunit S [Lachnospiraceae bacterium]